MSIIENKVVSSRHSFFGLMPILTISVPTLIGILVTTIMIFTDKKEPFLFVGSVIASGGGIYLILKALTAKYLVTPEYLDIKHIWAKRKLSWQEVREINVIPNYFSRYNIRLFIQGEDRPIGIHTSFIGNGKELGQAIIDAAMYSNPNIQLKGSVKAAFGTPPFGIFIEKPNS
jgi:hypothetical protein